MNPKRTFSAWSYLEASPAEFLKDLEELEKMIGGAIVRPAFMRAERADALGSTAEGS